jgi:hypothetical protein
LGDAYLEAKQLGKAVATWRKAAEAFRRDGTARHLRQTEAKIAAHEAED